MPSLFCFFSIFARGYESHAYTVRLPRKHLQEPHGRVHTQGPGARPRHGRPLLHRVRGRVGGRNRQSPLSSGQALPLPARRSVRSGQARPSDHKGRLFKVRPHRVHGFLQSAPHPSHHSGRSRRQNPSSDGLHRHRPRRGRPLVHGRLRRSLPGYSGRV